MRGGRRPGAGRPPGSKNRVRHEAKERLRRLLDPIEATLVKKLLLSGDQRVALETLRLVWSITDPQPRPSVGIVHSAPALQEFLERLALRRLGGADTPPRPALAPVADGRGIGMVEAVASDAGAHGSETQTARESRENAKEIECSAPGPNAGPNDGGFS